MAILTKSEPDLMRACRGETWGKYLGRDVCLHEAEVWDFKRVTYRLFGVPVWRHDYDRREVPLHEFIAHCLGMR